MAGFSEDPFFYGLGRDCCGVILIENLGYSPDEQAACRSHLDRSRFHPYKDVSFEFIEVPEFVAEMLVETQADSSSISLLTTTLWQRMFSTTVPLIRSFSLLTDPLKIGNRPRARASL